MNFLNRGARRFGTRAALVAHCLIVGGLLSGQFAWAETEGAQALEVLRFDTVNDFGGVGLLQMPSARMMDDGTLIVASGRVAPYFRNAFGFQVLPWMEGILRYSSIQNQLYGPVSFSGDQSYKDRSADLKFRLVEESAYSPAIALGFRDVVGTGLFGGEFLVMSRRYYDLDITLGMGWGNLGARGQIPNPFGLLSKRFKSRPTSTGQTGSPTGEYFHGERASLFGGVVWHTPIDGLNLKLEYDGNDYQHEAGKPLPVSSPFNVGLAYRVAGWADISLGYERGNTLQAQLVLHTNVRNPAPMPKFDSPPDAVKPRDLQAEMAARPVRQRTRDEDRALSLRLSRELESRDFAVDRVRIGKRSVTVEAASEKFRSIPQSMGRVARVLANELPPEIEEIRYVPMESGLKTAQVSFFRKDLEKAANYEGSPEEIAAHTRFGPPPTDESEDVASLNRERYPAWHWGWAPGLRQQIGGPDNPYFYQIFMRVDGGVQLTRGFSLEGAALLNLYNNFSGLKLASDSELPHVRSDIKEYLKQGANAVERLQADYVANLGANWYGRVSAGLFEEMFGGYGGELLFRPYGKDWAVGGNIYKVRQRAYDERFGFRDYSVVTGHADFYYQLPFYNLLAKLSVGRYLAGDTGATIDLSRHFHSGAVIGVFATKTNVSAAQFGEGSFDKGFYISVPMDLLSFYSSRSSVGVAWRPLTRDGGQRLSVSKDLYQMTNASSPDALLGDWTTILN